jgi:acylpyruvate hydrolase
MVLDLTNAYDFYINKSGKAMNSNLPARLPGDMVSFLKSGENTKAAVKDAIAFCIENISELPKGTLFREDEIKLRTPILNPPKIICIGTNYKSNAGEMPSKMSEYPKLFPKFSCVLIGPDESIVKPKMSDQVDYEAELAVVIGKEGRNISEEQAFEYVAGYSIMNDISARNIQFQDNQLTLGKNFATFAPVGPYLVTSDEIERPDQLGIKLWLNGKLLQDSSTKFMIFDIPFLISFISKIMPLEAGDIVATGSPEGIGCFRNPPVFMFEGDSVAIEIEGIGVLKNAIVAEQ